MKKLYNLFKKSINWYSKKYTECYNDRYEKYAYRFY